MSWCFKACACHVPGVNTSADSSRCDSVTGQCACKSRVMRRACDMCRDTYWKLTADNEAGCEGIQWKSIRKKVSEQQILREILLI